jgi:uncharacterized membrane protein SpoIIM required for sporulation
MISTYWLEKRQSHWTRLERLLDQGAGQGLKSLTRLELQELGLLYRQAAADLSTLREDPSGKSYARSLNLLLARAHNTIYAGQKSSPWSIVRFYRYTYPQIFRRNLYLINTAFLLFVAGGLAGMLLSITQPEFMHTFLGPRMMESIDHQKMWTDSVVAVKPLASSAIMTNNLSVSFGAFAFGITAGIGTVYMMVFNGVLIGVIGVACWLGGMSLSLWSFVAPHGVLELPAIFIAGGAGLRIAQGHALPRLAAAPRLAGQSRWRSRQASAGHGANADRRRANRRFLLAVGVSACAEVCRGGIGGGDLLWISVLLCERRRRAANLDRRLTQLLNTSGLSP